MADKPKKELIGVQVETEAITKLVDIAWTRRLTKSKAVREAVQIWIKLGEEIPHNWSMETALDEMIQLWKKEQEGHKEAYLPTERSEEPPQYGHYPLEEMPQWAKEHTIKDQQLKLSKPKVGK